MKMYVLSLGVGYVSAIASAASAKAHP